MERGRNILMAGLLGVIASGSAGGCLQRGTEGAPQALPRLEAFVGSASKPATEEAAALFERQTGIHVDLHFGGSGQVLSQMILGRRGDLYFPGSSDYMEKAKRAGVVDGATERRVVYLVPAINVPAGNPKGITGLADLARPDVRVAIARPDSVCVGLYAVEVLHAAGLWQTVGPRIVTHAESCAKVAQLAALGSVDAVLGWRVFHYWNPDKIDTILLQPAQIPRVGYIPIAVSSFSKQPDVARRFIDFLLSPDGRAVFRKWHYLADEPEARPFAAPSAPVGGEWRLPDDVAKEFGPP